MIWTEREIARAVWLHVFDRKHLVVIPNCYFPGSECDLLIVRDDRRLMDVEIKISRADLKADQHKDKWLKPWDFAANGWRSPREGERGPVSHPAKIWKHYYCLPKAIWKPELAAEIQPASGILLMDEGGLRPHIAIERRAKPNKEATAIDADDMIALAKSMSARMWAAYGEVDLERRDKIRLAPKIASVDRS